MSDTCTSSPLHNGNGNFIGYSVFPSGTFTFTYRKTNFLTNLKSKIKTKLIKMKRNTCFSRRPCVKTEYR